MDRLHEAQTVFQKTGGTHAVALASPDGKVFIHAEDVGRHNAMDKVIGRAVLTRQDLTGLVALLSGRISFEMALKAIRVGIPILAAVSAPTSMALNLAQELNLTLVPHQLEMRDLVAPTDTEAQVLMHLTKEATHIDTLCRISGLPTPTVTSTLAMLELKGLARQVGGMNYILN